MPGWRLAAVTLRASVGGQRRQAVMTERKVLLLVLACYVVLLALVLFVR